MKEIYVIVLISWRILVVFLCMRRNTAKATFYLSISRGQGSRKCSRYSFAWGFTLCLNCACTNYSPVKSCLLSTKGESSFLELFWGFIDEIRSERPSLIKGVFLPISRRLCLVGSQWVVFLCSIGLICGDCFFESFFGGFSGSFCGVGFGAMLDYS